MDIELYVNFKRKKKKQKKLKKKITKTLLA